MDVSLIDGYDSLLASYREAGDAPIPPCPLVSPAFRMEPPYRVGIAHLLLKPRFLLLDPTGTGKTPTALAAYGYLRQTSPAMRLLVVARKSVIHQWAAASARFLPSLGVEVVGYGPTGRELQREQRWHQYARWFAGETPILIGTYATIAADLTYSTVKAGEKPRNGALLRALRVPKESFERCTLIIDEIQRTRGRSGKLIYPALAQIANASHYVWGLTATPIFDKLDDLYAIMELVRYGTLSPYQDFAARYYIRELGKLPIPKHYRYRKDPTAPPPKERRFWKILGTKNLDSLMLRLRPFYLMRPFETFAAYMPDVRVVSTMVDMGAAQRKLYHRILQQHFPKQIDPSFSATAARLAAARTAGKSRMEMIASLLYAQLALDAPSVLGSDVPSAKEEELVRLLTEDHPTEQVIIFTRFEMVATRLRRVLTEAGLTVGRITGKENAQTRRATQLAFQQGTLRVCLITSAGGEGLDLQAASTLVMYDLPWSWGELVQVIGRARRVGSQHQTILVHLLGIPHTLDAHTLSLLQRKERLIAATFSISSLYLDSASFDDDLTQLFTPSTPDDALSSEIVTSDAFVSQLFWAATHEGESPTDQPESGSVE